MKELDGTDIVYFDLQVNNGDIWRLKEETKIRLCGSTKFIKREFIGNTRCPEGRLTAEDYIMYNELLKKNPTEKFTNIVLKHYNHPREGSLTDIYNKKVEQNT